MPVIVMPEQAQYILDRLESAGYAAFVVGGCVRDAIMQHVPHDWDICTSATPEQMMQVFCDFPVIETGLKHGTLTVLIEKEPFEVTTYRLDGDYSDGRHPDAVTFTDNIELDLARRDFTMNAIAYSPKRGLCDPFGGAQDIEQKVIRCVGQAKARFIEDSLRILRAMRFAATLGFAIEAETSAAMLNSADLLSRVSAERIQQELRKMLLGQQVGRVLMAFGQILCVPIPEISPAMGFLQHNPYHLYDVWEHTIHAVGAACDKQNLPLSLAALFHDIAKPNCYTQTEDGIGHFYGHAPQSAIMAEEILRRLKFETAVIEQTVALIAYHDATLVPTRAAVKRWLNKLSPDTLRLLIDLQRSDRAAQNPAMVCNELEKLAQFSTLVEEIVEKGECFSVRQLAVGGEDILCLGLSPGPQVGKLLAVLLEAVIAGETENEREALLSLAAEWMKTNL